MTPNYTVAFYTHHSTMGEGLHQATYETEEKMAKALSAEVELFFKNCGYAQSSVMDTMERLGVFNGHTYGTSHITIDGGKFGSIGATYWCDLKGLNIRVYYMLDGKEKYYMEILVNQIKH